MRTATAMLVSVLALAALAPAANAQADRPWYESRPEIARLHAPVGSFVFRLSPVWAELLLPNTPGSIAPVLLRHPPVQLSIHSRPELASFLVSDDQRMNPIVFDTIGRDRDWVVSSYESSPLPMHFKDRLHEGGLQFQLATPEELERAQEALCGLHAIGRILAVRMNTPLRFIAVRDLRHGIRAYESLSVADGYVLLDIGAFAEHAKPFDPLGLNTLNRSDSAARSLMREYVERMGEQLWERLPQAQKDDFIERFGPVSAGQTIAGTRPRPTRFIEAFVVATLYPTTFETQPVGTFSIPGPRVPGPPAGEFLERIRYVDALLDPIEHGFLGSIPESAFETPPTEDR